MGNGLNGASLISNDTDYPCRVQLGRYAFIDVTEVDYKEWYNDEKLSNERKMIYALGASSICELLFERNYPIKNNKKAILSVHDADKGAGSSCEIRITIRKTDTGNLEPPAISLHVIKDIRGEMSIFHWDPASNRIIDVWGGVTELNTFLYGKGRRASLVVIESKKKSITDPNPYMVTVNHYLAVDDEDFFNPKMDIGLSVVVKIQVSNDFGLKYTVEGPERHPSSSLFYMFDQVRKHSGAWKPSWCPHCANLQKQRKSFMTSESEDNDSFPPRHGNGYKQKSESMVANESRVKGNYNGSLFTKYFHFYKR
ncbi:unnamed protein product [Lathyrus sativus]|nr:unnamed protein product [Lathyrus sativus]